MASPRDVLVPLPARAILIAAVVTIVGCSGGEPLSDTDSSPTAPTATTPTATTPTATNPTTTNPTTGMTGTDTEASATDTGGETTGGAGSFCTHECSADADCLIGGMDAGFTCQVDRCVGEPVDACASDEECVAELSGWSAGMPCTAGGGECEASMQVCLEVEGAGHCVAAPGDFILCEDLGLDTIDAIDIDGAMVMVCAESNATCDADGFCFVKCEADTDCASAAYPVCNVASGQCECGDDTHCATIGIASLSVCLAGACGCGEDQHCVDDGSGDLCVAGLCGCSGDMACEGVDSGFDGGTIVCAM